MPHSFAILLHVLRYKLAWARQGETLLVEEHKLHLSDDTTVQKLMTRDQLVNNNLTGRSKDHNAWRMRRIEMLIPWRCNTRHSRRGIDSFPSCQELGGISLLVRWHLTASDDVIYGAILDNSISPDFASDVPDWYRFWRTIHAGLGEPPCLK